MAAYRRVDDSRHLQADCQEPGSAPEPYARQSSMDYLYTFTFSDDDGAFVNTFLFTYLFVTDQFSGSGSMIGHRLIVSARVCIITFERRDL